MKFATKKSVANENEKNLKFATEKLIANLEFCDWKLVTNGNEKNLKFVIEKSVTNLKYLSLKNLEVYNWKIGCKFKHLNTKFFRSDSFCIIPSSL